MAACQQKVSFMHSTVLALVGLTNLPNKVTAGQKNACARQQISAHVSVYIYPQIYSRHDIGTQDKREEKLVSLKQRATHVTVETVREVIAQIAESALDYLGLVAERITVVNKMYFGVRFDRGVTCNCHSA